MGSSPRLSGRCAILAACIGFAGPAAAGPLDPLQRFADGLEGSGAHAQATLEFKRMLFFSRTPEDSLTARRGMMRNLEASGSLREAYAQAQSLLAMEKDPARRSGLEWRSLRLLIRLSDAETARDRAYGLLATASAPDSGRLLQFLTALEIEESQPDQAILWAERLASVCPGSRPALRDTLPGLLKRPPPKSPVLAMILSGVVPGLGQLYAGVPAGSLNSLLLNGLTGYGAVHGFMLGRPAEFALYLALFQRFYLGGIKVAGARAEDANLDQAKTDKRRALEWVESACPAAPAVTIPASQRVRQKEPLFLLP